MNENSPIEENSIPGGKTTFTFRIMPDVKLQLAEKASALGLSPAQYVEALVLKAHNRANSPSHTKGDLPMDDGNWPKEMVDLYQYFLRKLKTDFKEFTPFEIVTACLAHALENKEALWQRSLNTFLNRITTGYYQTKNHRHDN